MGFFRLFVCLLLLLFFFVLFFFWGGESFDVVVHPQSASTELKYALH